MLAAACGGDDEVVRRDEPLRVLGAERDLRIGTAVDDVALTDDPRYEPLLAREVDMVVAENAMKWSSVQPERGVFDFEAADRLVDFAGRHGMAVRGHTLLWHRSVPDWVADAQWGRDEAVEVLREHITTVVGRYRGRVEQWDVVNEPIARDGDGLEANPWLRMIGPDHVALAFEFARDADPTAELYLNDFDGSFPGERTERVVELAEQLASAGTAIDGVGIQFHVLGRPDELDADAVVDVFDRIGAAGLDAAVTEADVRLELGAEGRPDDDQLHTQADLYEELLRGCLRAVNCDTFVMWGLTDRWSWVPGQFEGFGAATLFDDDYRPKPAHERLQLVLS